MLRVRLLIGVWAFAGLGFAHPGAFAQDFDLYSAPILSVEPPVTCNQILTHDGAVPELKPAEPRRKPWKPKLKTPYAVVDQGETGACWAVEGSQSLTLYFQSLGLLGAEERLSYEFYYHAQLLSVLEKKTGTLKKFVDVDRYFTQGGAFIDDLFKLTQKYGLVTDKMYAALPKKLYGTKFGSMAYRARFIEAIKQIRKAGTWDAARSVLLQYVGDLDRFAAPPALLNHAVYKDLKMLHMMRTRSADDQKYVEPVKYLLDGVKASLDYRGPKGEKIAVVIGIDVNDTVFEQLSRLETSVGVKHKKYESWAHSMLAVDYELNEAGEIEYLLVMNSWGEGWGDRGFVVMDRSFLEAYLADIEQFSNIEGFATADRKLKAFQREKGLKPKRLDL